MSVNRKISDNPICKRTRLVFLTVHHKNTLQGIAHMPHPLKKLAAVCVRRISANRANLGAHWNFIAKNLHGFFAIEALPPQRPPALVTDNKEHAFWIR